MTLDSAFHYNGHCEVVADFKEAWLWHDDGVADERQLAGWYQVQTFRPLLIQFQASLDKV